VPIETDTFLMEIVCEDLDCLLIPVTDDDFVCIFGATNRNMKISTHSGPFSYKGSTLLMCAKETEWWRDCSLTIEDANRLFNLIRTVEKLSAKEKIWRILHSVKITGGHVNIENEPQNWFLLEGDEIRTVEYIIKHYGDPRKD
jgi:hypothetical protein